MKKLAVLLLVGVMAFGCVACGNTDNNAGGKETEKISETKVEIADANDILTKIWEEYNANAGDDMKFSIIGGNVENMIMDTPAKFDVTLEGAEEALTLSYCIPTEAIAMTDDVATMVHGMNANVFTAAAYHVTEAGNVQTVVDSIKAATLNNQWMCGNPETLIIVTIGDDYVVSAFGMEAIETFQNAITTVYGDAAEVVVEEAIAQ